MIRLFRSSLVVYISALIICIYLRPASAELTPESRIRSVAETAIAKIELEGLGPQSLGPDHATLIQTSVTGKGIGILVSPEGAILTATHVVGKDELFDRREGTADVIGRKLFVSLYRQSGIPLSLGKPTSSVILAPNGLDLAAVRIPPMDRGQTSAIRIRTCQLSEGQKVYVMPWRSATEPEFIGKPDIIEGKVLSPDPTSPEAVQALYDLSYPLISDDPEGLGKSAVFA